MSSHCDRLSLLFALTLLGYVSTVSCRPQQPRQGPPYKAFQNPERVVIQGYHGDAMEPFLSPDGRTLFFNNLNDPSVNTDLYYAERLNDLTFKYCGEVGGVNTPALEGVPTMDRDGNFYFVSTRSYSTTLSTLYRGRFADGRVSNVEIVPGVSRKEAGIVNFDVGVSPDGADLYFVDSRFKPGSGPESAGLVVAHRHGSGFERARDSAVLFKNINTGDLQYAPAISADGLELFFTRVGSAKTSPPAIFRAVRKRKGEPFGLPQRVVAAVGFVEGPALSPDERSLYYHKKEGAHFVLYRVTRK